MKNRRMILAVTPGDPEGIGPELVWKTIRTGKVPKNVTLLCIGAAAPFKKLRAPVIEAQLGFLETPPIQKKPFVSGYKRCAGDPKTQQKSS